MLLNGIPSIQNIGRVLEIGPVPVNTPNACQVDARFGTDAGQVTHTGLGSVLRVGLHAIHHVDIRGADLVDRRHLDNTLAGKVGHGIDTGQHVATGDIRQGADKVREGDPVQPLLALREVAHLGLVHPKLILLDDVVVVLLGRHATVALHHQDIAGTERVVQDPLVRIEINPPGGLVVMVHLHHSGENHVVVLPAKL